MESNSANGDHQTPTTTTNPNNGDNDNSSSPPLQPQTVSKSAQKKLLKQQKFEAKKAAKKAAAKQHKKREAERKRREWDEKLASVDEDERTKIIEARRELRKELMAKRSIDKEMKIEKMKKAKEFGQNVVIDLEFSHLMAPNEIHSLVHQIMYCYAVNGRCSSPCHLWLTGCNGEIETELNKLPGFDNWSIEKENLSYIEALQDQRDKLVYLTADAETMLEDLDSAKVYIIGGLVDRNRWKGLTYRKAIDQGIQTAKLPIGNYLRMSSSQVLTVNQVIEILLKYLETRDWKTAFFHVIPLRKRGESDIKEDHEANTHNNHQDGNESESEFFCT